MPFRDIQAARQVGIGVARLFSPFAEGILIDHASCSRCANPLSRQKVRDVIIPSREGGAYKRDMDEAQRNPTFIREWRQFRDMTQQELADAIDSSKSRISELENGRRRYNQDLLEQIAGALDCTPADLLSRNPSVEPEPIVRLWSRIDQRDRDRARRALEVFDPEHEKRA